MIFGILTHFHHRLNVARRRRFRRKQRVAPSWQVAQIQLSAVANSARSQPCLPVIPTSSLEIHPSRAAILNEVVLQGGWSVVELESAKVVELMA